MGWFRDPRQANLSRRVRASPQIQCRVSRCRRRVGGHAPRDRVRQPSNRQRLVLRTVCFGGHGPLLWSRVASFLTRLTAVMHTNELARTECFVDDPFIAVGGSPIQRQRVWLRTLVLWLAMGFRLSWRKGVRGRRLEWIGAQISSWRSSIGVPGVEIAITLERVQKLVKTCAQHLEQSRIPKQSLHVGRASWMASLMSQTKPFSTMIRAACSTATSTGVAIEHVKKPRKWLLALCEQNMAPIVRRCGTRAPFVVPLTFAGH